MYSKQELVKLWSNNEKRQAFINDYKTWGVWCSLPELDLTFYRYELPDGKKLIVMEYLRMPYPSESTKGDNKPIICTKHYLQLRVFFNPSPTSMYEMTSCLKNLKEEFTKELKRDKDKTEEM